MSSGALPVRAGNMSSQNDKATAAIVKDDGPASAQAAGSRVLPASPTRSLEQDVVRFLLPAGAHPEPGRDQARAGS